MCIACALKQFAQSTGTDPNLIDGIKFTLREGGRNPHSFQTLLDTDKMTAEEIERGVMSIVSDPETLAKLNECLTAEEGVDLEFLHDPLRGIQIARIH